MAVTIERECRIVCSPSRSTPGKLSARRISKHARLAHRARRRVEAFPSAINPRHRNRHRRSRHRRSQGTETARATDDDPLAVDIARDNARKNGVVSLVRVLKATGFAYEKLRSAPDLVLANLLERALYELAPTLARYIPPHGRAILSGLTSDQARGTQARYRARGFILENRIILDGWTTLVIVRRNGQALRD